MTTKQKKIELEVNEIECDNDLKILRKQLTKINLLEPGIHILDVPPGTGKSHRVKEILRELNSFILATATHKLLGEEYKGLKAKHWKGMNKENCEQFHKIKSLKEEGVPIGLLCTLNGCNKKQCNYWKQFNTKKAITPHELLMDDKIRYKTGNNKGNLKFEILVLDESLDKFHDIIYNKEKIIDSLNIIKQYNSSNICENFVKTLNEMDYYLFEEFFDDLFEARNNAFKAALFEENKDNLKKIVQFDIYGLRKYFYYKSIYPSIQNYSEPALYRILDLAREGIPIILLDATFDEKRFKKIIERYLCEDSKLPRSFLINPKINLDLIPPEKVNIKVHRAKLHNKSVKIKRMNKNNFYHKSGFFTEYNIITEKGLGAIDNLKFFVESLLRRYNKVGIITYKLLKPYFQDMAPTEYFFNLKGSNAIKDVDALVLIGTPLPNQKDVITQYNKLCLTNYDENHVERQNIKTESYVLYSDVDKKVSYFCDEHGEFYSEKKPRPLMLKKIVKDGASDDYSLSDFYMMLCESEKYQAIHRARLFRTDSSTIPEVFIFGDIAERIKEEFEVEYLTNNKTDDFISSLTRKVSPSYLFRSINRLYLELGDVKKVARELKLYKKADKYNGYNTRFINAIINKDVSVEDIRILQGALNVSYDKELIKTKFQGLKCEDWFIDDCIYYMENGDFINWKLL